MYCLAPETYSVCLTSQKKSATTLPWAYSHYRLRRLRGVIWHLLFWDLSKSEIFSKIKLPLMQFNWLHFSAFTNSDAVKRECRWAEVRSTIKKKSIPSWKTWKFIHFKAFEKFDICPNFTKGTSWNCVSLITWRTRQALKPRKLIRWEENTSFSSVANDLG